MTIARLALLSCLLATPFAVGAESHDEATTVDVAQDAAPAVSARMTLAVVRPVIDENGDAVRDTDGNPTVLYVPAADTTILPTDEVRYLAEMTSVGAAASNLEMVFDLPAEAQLIPTSVVSDVTAAFAVGDGETPETRTAIFDDTGALSPAYTALEDGSQVHLYVTIPALPSEATGTISYNMTIR